MKEEIIRQKLGRLKHDSELTKTFYTPETADEQIALLKDLFGNGMSQEDKILQSLAKVEEIVSGYLQDRNLPHVFKKVYKYKNKRGEGKARLPTILSQREEDEKKSKEVQVEPQWYAAETLQYAHFARESIKKDDKRQAMWNIFLFGQAFSFFIFSDNEANARAGRHRTGQATREKMETAKNKKKKALVFFRTSYKTHDSKRQAARETVEYIKKNDLPTYEYEYIRKWPLE